MICCFGWAGVWCEFSALGAEKKGKGKGRGRKAERRCFELELEVAFFLRCLSYARKEKGFGVVRKEKYREGERKLMHLG